MTYLCYEVIGHIER